MKTINLKELMGGVLTRIMSPRAWRIAWRTVYWKTRDRLKYPGFTVYRDCTAHASEMTPCIVGRYGECTFPNCGCGSRARCGVR